VVHDQTNHAGTITIPKDTSARTQATNHAGFGPTMTNTYLTGHATGTFTSALYAFTAAPHYETAKRMKAVLQNYAKANEPLAAFGLTETAFELGLREGMTHPTNPRVGIITGNYRKIPGGPKKHDMAMADFTWTAWIQDHSNPEAADEEASLLQGTLYSIAVEEQRHWGDLVHDTEVRSPSTSGPIRREGELDRFFYIVKVPMSCRFWGGQWQDDPKWSTKGGRYAEVTVV